MQASVFRVARAFHSVAEISIGVTHMRLWVRALAVGAGVAAGPAAMKTLCAANAAMGSELGGANDERGSGEGRVFYGV